MYEANYKAVECRDSKRKDVFEIGFISYDRLKDYIAKGFAECEAFVLDEDGCSLTSICRMSYDDTKILCELPGEDATPVPLAILFDDVALAKARNIRGGLVSNDDIFAHRTALAENARYIIKKEFRDVRDDVILGRNYADRRAENFYIGEIGGRPF